MQGLRVLRQCPLSQYSLLGRSSMPLLYRVPSLVNNSIRLNSSTSTDEQGPEDNLSASRPKSFSPAGGRRNANYIGKREGDWTCGYCRAHNYSYRTSCFKCYAKGSDPVHERIERNPDDPSTAPLSTSAIPNIKPGDWSCPSCHYLNFSFRSHCLQCHTAAPPSDVRRTTSGRKAVDKEGRPISNNLRKDWICSRCSTLNFAFRRVCYQCSMEKPAEGEHIPHLREAKKELESVMAELESKDQNGAQQRQKELDEMRKQFEALFDEDSKEKPLAKEGNETEEGNVVLEEKEEIKAEKGN